MTRKVLILDTPVLCCWLRIPGKDTAGPSDDQWTPERIDALIEAARIHRLLTVVVPDEQRWIKLATALKYKNKARPTFQDEFQRLVPGWRQL